MNKPFVFFYLFVFIICFWVPATGEKLAVVLSRSAAAYESAKNGILWNCGYDVDVFNMEGDRFKGERIMKRFDARHHEAVIAIGNEAATQVCYVDKSIPVIYTMVLNQVDCMDKRDLNGVILKIDIAEQIGLIKKIFPNTNKIGVLYNPANSKKDIKKAFMAAQELQMSLIAIDVLDRLTLPVGLERLRENKIDVLWTVIDKTTIHPLSIKQLIKFSHTENVPLFGLSIYHVNAGAFAAFSVDFYTIGEQSINLLEKVKQYQSMPKIERPNLTVLYVNKKDKQRWPMNSSITDAEIRWIE